MPITHKTQIDDSTCVAACAAMLMDVSVELVASEFQKPFTNREIELHEYLFENGVKIVRTEDRYRMEPGKVYLLLVPALDAVGMFHQVLCDTREGCLQIFDPARKLNQRYVGPGEAIEPGCTEIMTWVIDYEVLHAPAIGIEGEDV